MSNPRLQHYNLDVLKDMPLLADLMLYGITVLVLMYVFWPIRDSPGSTTDVPHISQERTRHVRHVPLCFSRAARSSRSRRYLYPSSP
jgi:hypothetical protein